MMRRTSGTASFRSVGPAAVLAGLLGLGVTSAATADDAAVGARDGFRWEESSSTSLGLWEGRRPVLVYNHGVIRDPRAAADRARSSYIHPLYGLDGEVLTDDFPEDHWHHRGVFWAWPHVEVDGRPHDLWMLRGIRHEFERWGAREAGRDSAVLEVHNAWQTARRKVVSEKVRIVAHPAGPDGRWVDLEFTWTPEEQPLRLVGAEDKSYGGLTLRVAPGTDTVITTPLGSDPRDLYMTPLPWADLSRRLAATGRVSGVAILIAPDHPDFPPTWLTRHYGVLCLGWPGVGGRTLAADESVRVRYRLWVHRGGATGDQLAEQHRRYAQPDPE